MKDKLLGLYGALAAMGGTSYSVSPIVTASSYGSGSYDLTQSETYQYLMDEIKKMTMNQDDNVQSLPCVVHDAMYLLNLMYADVTADWSDSSKDSEAKVEHYVRQCVGLTFINNTIKTVLPKSSTALVPFTITDEMIRKDWVDTTTQMITIPYEIFAQKAKMLMNWGSDTYCIMVESKNYPGSVIPFCYDEKFATPDGSVGFVFKQPQDLSLGKLSTAWCVVIKRKVKSAGTISSYTNNHTIY
jgi:hypothetical protein